MPSHQSLSALPVGTDVCTASSSRPEQDLGQNIRNLDEGKQPSVSKMPCPTMTARHSELAAGFSKKQMDKDLPVARVQAVLRGFPYRYFAKMAKKKNFPLGRGLWKQQDGGLCSAPPLTAPQHAFPKAVPLHPPHNCTESPRAPQCATLPHSPAAPSPHSHSLEPQQLLCLSSSSPPA